MPTATPQTIHGLPVMSAEEAQRAGFQSITTDIHAENEKRILAGVCQHRNPDRAALIYVCQSVYQLAIRREDISRIED